MSEEQSTEVETEIVDTSNYVEYSSNNSGGRWWLTDEDWHNLAAAGWTVKWYADEPEDKPFASFYKDGRHLGALASRAERRGISLQEAANEFENITGQSLSDEGCNCCGEPHGLTEYTFEHKYVSSVEIVRNNSWGIS